MSIHFGAIRLLIKKQLKSCNNYCVFLAFTSTTLIFFFLLWQTQNEGLLWLFTNGLPLVGITYNSMNMLWTWVGRLSSHLMQKYLPAPGSIPWNRLCYFSFPCLETLQCYFVIWWLKDHWKICCSKKLRAGVVTQLKRWSLPTINDLGSSPVNISFIKHQFNVICI